MKEQNRVVEKIKNLVEAKVAKHDRKVIELLEVSDLGVGKIKVLRFRTNLKSGNVLTETSGQLFIGSKGGVRGKIYTFGNTATLESRRHLYMVDMWI